MKLPEINKLSFIIIIFLLSNFFFDCHFFSSKVYEMELSMSTPEKFRFPHYEELCWYVARQLLLELRGANAPHLMLGARCLYAALKNWAHQGIRGSSNRVPEGINASKLLKELQKELRSTEKQVN